VEEEDIKLDKNTTYGSSEPAYHIPARYRSQVEQLWSCGGLACTFAPANALRNEVVGREVSHSEDHLAMHTGLMVSETLTVKHCAVGLLSEVLALLAYPKCATGRLGGSTFRSRPILDLPGTN
jgi:hypothetical protein